MEARLGLAGRGLVGPGMETTECVTGCRNRRWDLRKARLGMAWHGRAGHGSAWRGLAGLGRETTESVTWVRNRAVGLDG